MDIRNAAVSDLKIISDIEAECFPVSEAASIEDFKSRLSIFPNHFWLLIDGQKAVGFVNGLATDELNLSDNMYKNAKIHNEKGKWLMILGVDTIPSYRNQGCASKLIKHVISETKNQGRDGIVLTCKEKLIPFYSKFGFVNEGKSKSVHGGAVWYQMRLKFKTNH